MWTGRIVGVMFFENNLAYFHLSVKILALRRENLFHELVKIYILCSTYFFLNNFIRKLKMIDVF